MSTLTTPKRTPPNLAESLLHYTCCDDDLALCGTDVTDEPWVEDGNRCAVCVELVGLPCSTTCGPS